MQVESELEDAKNKISALTSTIETCESLPYALEDV